MLGFEKALYLLQKESRRKSSSADAPESMKDTTSNVASQLAKLCTVLVKKDRYDER